MMQNSTLALLCALCVLHLASQAQASSFGLACEGYDATLRCSQGSIRILEAMYGRTSEHLCGTKRPNLNCKSAISNLVAKDLCEGRTSCNLKASNTNFGEPCSGTNKYLSVYYDCV